MLGGGGNAQMACINWRRVISKNNPRNGRTLPPKSQRPSRKSPSASIKPELTIRSALAAPAFRAKYELSPAVRLWSASPIPDAGLVRAPISDCVQNQSARTIPVTRSRNSMPRRRPEFSACVIERSSSPAHVQLFVERALRHLHRQSARFAQIEFSGAEIRKSLDVQELGLWRPPQRGQVTIPQFLKAFFQLRLIQRVQHDEAFAFLLVGHGGDNKSLFGGAGQFLQEVLDFDVRHHLAANFAEAAQAVNDAQKTILIHSRNVSGVVPAVAENLGGLLRLVEVAAHDVRAADEQQPRLIHSHRLQRIGVHDLNRDSRQGVADAAALRPDLAERRRAKIDGVYRDNRRTFGAAVALVRTDAKMILEGLRNPVGQFFGTSHNQAQAAELFRGTAPRVRAKERRS